MIDTSSEQWRHACEVRMCIRNGAAWFEKYAIGVREKRGGKAASRLWRDVRTQAQAGNTGAPGQWIEQQQEIAI